VGSWLDPPTERHVEMVPVCETLVPHPIEKYVGSLTDPTKRYGRRRVRVWLGRTVGENVVFSLCYQYAVYARLL
jgi:hypothetical protein